ncbi:MAG: alpha/beta hydrolase [Vicinamibacterales bacterium]
MPALLHRDCSLHYDVRGSGPPVVFIQGVGLHGAGWTPQIDELAAHFACLSFDNRGMGQSLPASRGLTVEQMADDAIALMDALGWTSAHIVGHSLGGLVALQLGLSHRSRVKSLALLCTFADGASAAPLTWRMMWVGLGTRVGTRRMRRRSFLRLVMPPAMLEHADTDALAATLAPLFGHDLADQPDIVNAQLKAMRQARTSDELGQLAGLPTLVVSASHDPIAPPTLGRVIAAGIAGARHVELSHASHGVTIHSASEINRLLYDHFVSVGQRATDVQA